MKSAFCFSAACVMCALLFTCTEAKEKEITAALALLRNDEQALRKTGIKKLAEIGTAADRALPELKRLLEEGSSGDKKAVVFALPAIDPAGERSASWLVQALTDENAEVRSRSAHSLGRMKHANSAASLLKAATDKEPQVRGEAAFSLGQLPFPRAESSALADRMLPLLHKEHDPEVHVLFALARARLDPAHVPDYLALLKNRDFRMRAFIFRTMANLDLEEQDRLKAGQSGLADAQAAVRFNALLLIKSNPFLWKPLLPQLLLLFDRSKADELRLVSEILLLLDAEGSLSARRLLATLKQGGKENKRQAAMLLGRMAAHDLELVQGLEAALKTEDAELRREAARALGLKGEVAGPAATSLGRHLDGELEGYVVAEALASLGWPGEAELARRLTAGSLLQKRKAAFAFSLKKEISRSSREALEQAGRNPDRELSDAARAALKKLSRK